MAQNAMLVFMSFFFFFFMTFPIMEGKVDTPHHSLSEGNFGLLHYSFYLVVKNSVIWSIYSWKTLLLFAFICALTLPIPCSLFSFRIAIDLSS